MVESRPSKPLVAGSSPVSRLQGILKMCCSIGHFCNLLFVNKESS